MALAVFFMVCCFFPDLRPAVSVAKVELPALVRLDNETMDVRLILHDPEGHPESSIINPSLLVKDSEPKLEVFKVLKWFGCFFVVFLRWPKTS